MPRQPGRVLVTGGAGFIGSHLVEALLERGETVRVIDNLATGHRSNLAHLNGYEWVEGDLTRPEDCRAACDGVTRILHQAAVPSVPRSVADPIESFRTGPEATMNLLEAARLAGVERVVFAASSSAYGDTVDLPKHEAMLPNPLSPYAAGKLSGEQFIQVYARTMGLDGVSLRYFNVFGPRQDPTSPYSGVISLFAKLMKRGDRPVLYGDGGQTRDFTFITNVVQANLLALDAAGPLGGNAFNVGTGTQTSLLDLIAAINQRLGTAITPEFRPERPGDVRHSLASLDRITTTLGYRPTVTFAEGLRRTLETS